MTLADSAFGTALARALFHFVWQGALIALVLAIGLYVCRPASARLRYGLACVAMLSMLAAFALTTAWAWPRSRATLTVRQGHPPVRGPLPLMLLPEAESIPRTGEPTREWIVTLWMLGIGLLALRSLLSWGAAQRLKRVGVCAAPAVWQERVADLAKRIRLSRPVVLLESCLAETPAAIGLFRPVILAPVGLLAGLSADQMECILIHELAHIRRCDYLVNLLQALTEDLLFYHPAVWWVSRVVRAERENCCDDVVVAARGESHGLASALAALEDYRWKAQEAAMAANGGHLMNRIRRLLEGREAPRAAFAPVFFAGVLAASAALSISTAQPQASSEGAAPRPPAALPADANRQVVIPVERHPARRPAPVLIAQAQSNPAPAPVAQPAGPPQPDSFPRVYNGKNKTFFFFAFERWRSEAFQTQNSQQGQQLLKQLETPYQKWLDEDVVYIISADERAAFRSLKTDEERQHFIEQFWLRRDPTPGTEQNEYMDEYYRRVSYANQHFAAGNVPGWKTDRGMVYIVYGPPDELDSRPSGGLYQRPAEEGGGSVVTFPFETWRYRYIEGEGSNVSIEFVDTAKTGEYHLAIDPVLRDLLLHVPGAGQMFHFSVGRTF